MNHTEKISFSTRLSAWALTLILCSQYLSTVLSLYIDASFFAPIILGAAFLSVIALILQKEWVIRPTFVMLIGVILIFAVGTQLYNPGQSSISALDLIVMCLVPCIFGGLLKTNYELVLRYAMYLLLPGLPVFTKLFAKGNNIYADYDAVTMGTAYALLTVLAASVLHFIFFRKQSGRFTKLLYLVTLVYLAAFTVMSYRGALAALFVTAVLALAFTIKNKARYLPALLILAPLVLLLFLNLNTVFTAVRDMLAEQNIRIAFIDKTLALGADSNLLHGRAEIYAEALRGFLDSPVYGHGLASFYAYTGYEFPHNFMLQFLFDGGLLLFIGMMWLLISGLTKAICVTRKTDTAKFAFLLLVAGISLSRLMVSAETWRIIAFWMMFGAVTNNSDALPETEPSAAADRLHFPKEGNAF